MGSSLCQLEPRPEWTEGEIELKIESPTPCIFFVTHTRHSGSSALTAGQRHSRLSGTHESRLSGTQHHSPSRSGTQRHCSAWRECTPCSERIYRFPLWWCALKSRPCRQQVHSLGTEPGFFYARNSGSTPACIRNQHFQFFLL